MRLPRITSAALILFGVAILPILIVSGCENRKPRIELAGGPTGGAAQSFAEALGQLIDQKLPEIRLDVENSPGSVENLLAVEKGLDLALVHAEDTYLGDQGKIPQHPERTLNVLAVARMFGTEAHLIVPKNSPYQTPYDLRNVRVAIGNPSSSSAQSAERYFHSLKLWDQIVPIYVSDVRGLKELILGSVDAVWMLTDVPNRDIKETNRVYPVRFLDLWKGTASGGFFQAYPYYSLSSIPAGSYRGQDQEIYTFESPVLLVANRKLDSGFVYHLLKVIFSAQGTAELQTLHPAARDLDVRKATNGVVISYHPGALRFLNETLLGVTQEPPAAQKSSLPRHADKPASP